jgi:MFS family permease
VGEARGREVDRLVGFSLNGTMLRMVALIGAVLALALLPSNLVATALPLLRNEWNASATQMGWVVASYQVGYAVAVLLILPLTDRIRTGLIIASGSALSAIGFVPFGLLAHDVWSASALRIVAGAGLAAVYLPGVRVVAAAAAPARRGFAVSLYVSAFYIGASVSLWLSGAFLGAFDWRGTALVLGLAALVGVPIALAAHASIPVNSSGRSAVLRLAVLRRGPLLRTILAYSGHSWELYVSRGWLAAFLAAMLLNSGLSRVDAAAEGGKWAALIAGVGTVGVWIGGWLSDRWGRPRSAAAIAACSGLMSLMFGYLGASPWVILIAIGCLFGILLAADSGIYSAAVTEYAPHGHLGSAQAAQAFIGFMASSISPVAAGIVLDVGGGFGGAFVLGGLASLAGAVALLPLAFAPQPRADRALVVAQPGARSSDGEEN